MSGSGAPTRGWVLGAACVAAAACTPRQVPPGSAGRGPHDDGGAPVAALPQTSAAPLHRGTATAEPLGSGAAASAEAALPSEPAPRIAALQARLLTVTDFTSTEVPEGARPILADLKRASRDFLAAELARVDLARAAAEDVDRAVGDTARTAGIRWGAEGSSDTRPGLWSSSITRSGVNPRYLIAGYYFTVPCGNDGGYLVYDLRATGGAALLLTVGSADYDSIAGAFWQLSFAVPPPGSPQPFFFAATRVEPWCTSALRRLQLLVLRPGPSPETPAILVDETVPVHLKGTYGVAVGASLVTLSFSPDDPGKLERRRWSIGKAGASKLDR